MKTWKTVISFAFALTAVAFLTAGGFGVQKTPAKADSAPVSVELIAPSSYEEYLPLEKPACYTASEDYTAIADGNLLYLFDKAEERYFCYDEYTKSIESVQFGEDGNLYFLSGYNVYSLSVDGLKTETASAQRLTEVTCDSFLIEDGAIYYIARKEICAYSLANGETRTLRVEGRDIERPLAYTEGVLYYLCKTADAENPYTLYALNLKTGSVNPITDFTHPFTSMAVANNLFCFTTESNESFYAYNYTELTASEHASSIAPVTKAEGGYTYLSSYGGTVYTVYKNTVKGYSVENAEFTDFEISASSSSTHRLNNADELCLSGETLFIADNGNQRISVFDTKTGAFKTPFVTELINPYLAAYKDTLLAASANKAVLYNLKSNGAPLFTLDGIEGNIVGAVSVYGRYYILTDDNHCYALKAENGEWSVTQTKKQTHALYAKAFTADVYGSLYIAYDNDAVYRFNEKELFTPEASGTKILEGVQNPKKLLVDYETSIYALSEGTLQKYALNGDDYQVSGSYTPDYGLVYDHAPCLASFTFGVDEEVSYFLYAGDYLVKSDELNIPKVNPIPVGNAAELIFGALNEGYELVQVETESILIEFDLSALQEATQFPYIAFERSQDTLTAIKLCEESGYAVLAIPQEKAGEYRTYLAQLSACTNIAQSDYFMPYESTKTAYITNDIPLYKFPAMNAHFSAHGLKRSDTVTLLGEISLLEREYYQVLIQTDGGALTGYIPKAYTTLFDGSTPHTEEIVFGGEPLQDELWRSVYILLGFGAICILVDFLILKKPKNDE
ncbi:MAG: hypothetical protein IKB20_02810 [Clostridia bacterium]|nr:hypothetical protein [Clostridia bacterium]